MPEHVMIVVGVSPPMIGGIETHVANLARSLVDIGHRVTIVTPTGQPGDTVGDDGVRVIRQRPLLWAAGIVAIPRPGTARRVAEIALETGVTAVSTHTRFFPMSFVGSRVAKRARVPLVHSEHGSDHVKGVSPLVGFASRLVDRSLGRSVLRSADRVLALSENVAAFVRRLSGIDAELFYNAIDVEAWAFEPPPPPRPEVVFVGRMVPGKGWDDTIAACSRIVASGRAPAGFHVTLLGAGGELEACRAQITAAGLDGIASADGAQPPSVVKQALSGAVLVNPTVLSEGFQTTLLEAAACGAQIVSYPVPGLGALRESGAPITEVPRGDVDALADAIVAVIAGPRPAMRRVDLESWGWPQRSRSFISAIERTRHG